MHPDIEEFTESESHGHEEAYLKAIAMYCDACESKYGENKLKHFNLNFGALYKNPELLRLVVGGAGNLQSVKVETNYYPFSSPSEAAQDCFVLNQMWRQAGKTMATLSLGHYFSAMQDRDNFRLPFEYFSQLEHLSVSYFPAEYVEKVSLYCPKMKTLQMCSVIESLTYVIKLERLEVLDFRPTGGYLGGRRTGPLLDDVVERFFAARGHQLKHLTFGPQVGVLQLPSLVYRLVSKHCDQLRSLALDLNIDDAMLTLHPLRMAKLRRFAFQGPSLPPQLAIKMFTDCPKLQLIAESQRHHRDDYRNRLEYFRLYGQFRDHE